MEQKSGNLIDTLCLYSEQTSALLRQALEREAAEGKQASQVNQPVESSESEEEAISEPSSGEEEEEETEESSPQTAASDPSDGASDAKAAKKTKKPPKPTQTEQQRQHTVKKFVENLVCDALPIHDSEALHLPTSLLGKPDDSAVAERNYVARSACHEFLALSEKLQKSPVLVVLLRSGRFAAGIFQGQKCLVHRACQRYTIRGKQGKAQSTQDGSRRPKSMGAQLRRQGEENLQQDIKETMEQWKSQIANTSLILLSCPKAMRKYLFEAIDPSVIAKNDSRLRRLPLDIGKPIFENVSIAHQVMMSVQLRQWVPPANNAAVEQEPSSQQSTKQSTPEAATAAPSKEPDVVFPLTPLHEACQKGDSEAIVKYLDNPQQLVACLNEHGEETQLSVETMLHRRVGPDFMTCLHYAAQCTETEAAAACATALLVQGKANPALLDARNRPPYFLSSHDKVRDSFRLARATLGEDYCKWDTVAKVGPALTQDDLDAKKEREAEKKRKKRARQKQKKAEDKAAAKAEEEKQKQLDDAKQKEQEAKRVRDGLRPKAAVAGGSVCDFCQTVVKGRKRKDMFSRLEYVYCSADCVQKHKRELMAAAAQARFGG